MNIIYLIISIILFICLIVIFVFKVKSNPNRIVFYLLYKIKKSNIDPFDEEDWNEVDYDKDEQHNI